MKALSHTIIYSFLVMSFHIANAQKDKPIYAAFTQSNDLVIAYKSGTCTVFSVPDLNIKQEFSPSDKKNKTISAIISPKKDKLMVYDSKIKGQIIWDLNTGIELYRINDVMSGDIQFKSNSEMMIPIKKSMNVSIPTIYDIESGEKLNDLTSLDMKFTGISFSKDGKYLLNYEESGTSTKGGFYLYDLNTMKEIIQHKIGENMYFQNTTQFLDHENIRFVYQEFVDGREYHTTLNLNQLVNGDIPENSFITDDEKFFSNVEGLYMDFKEFNTYVSHDPKLYIPLGDTYHFNYAVTDISSDKKWSALVSTNKNFVSIYDNTDYTEKEFNNDTYKMPNEVIKTKIED
jgi:hypothetical protein